MTETSGNTPAGLTARVGGAPSDHPCLVDELRTLFLFEKLSDEQLEWLCERGRIEDYPQGVVYGEGDTAELLFVLLSGTIALSQTVGGLPVETTRTDQRGVYAGAWASFLGEKMGGKYNASMRAITPVRFFVLPSADFNELMHQWFPMALHLLEGVFYGGKRQQQMIGERERLLALGSLSAGLTHELNNPAGAAVRAADELRQRIAGMRDKLAHIANGTWRHEQLVDLVDLQRQAVELVAKSPSLSPLEASDREDEITDWLEDHDVADAFTLAPAFVAAGADEDWFEGVLAEVGPEMLPGALKWLFYTVETEQLLNEITDSTTRISTLVAAAKQYSQMDRAPFQELNLHELLDSTLVIMGKKLGKGITVVKEYDCTLPEVSGYGAELNQVWTNLIDNAIQAMDGNGTLTIRTRREDECAVVEIGDTGSGIPRDVVGRIFEPFFTTKGIGEGTGLGLDISWRIVVNKHQGNLSVTSEPGATVFTVKLPIAGPQRAPADPEEKDES
ncbi:ATP-binding protein [Tsukamurella pseudospumae]|uniref:ATP-binding protein n=1 Tax=Tsukamurella pseudospumae TaxID=239498 RepID=UPI0009E8503E|nr:ATP-binding protein [Tsukamurella pseudospumae]